MAGELSIEYSFIACMVSKIWTLTKYKREI